MNPIPEKKHPTETTVEKFDLRKWNKVLEHSWRKFIDDEVGKI